MFAVCGLRCRYLRLITPTLYMNAVVECLKRYLLAQRVVVPGMVVTVLTCLLSPLYNWLFIFRCGDCSLFGLARLPLRYVCICQSQAWSRALDDPQECGVLCVRPVGVTLLLLQVAAGPHRCCAGLQLQPGYHSCAADTVCRRPGRAHGSTAARASHLVQAKPGHVCR